MEKEHIKKLISSLNELQIAYAFTGAFAVSYYGHPRMSTDIDVLIENDKDKLFKLQRRLQISGYDATERDVQKAIEECSHFPVFHRERTFPYFDFKIACAEDDISAIQKSIALDYHGVKCQVVSVEDLIIKKLEWNDLQDVEVMLIRHKKIDMKRLEKEAKEKSVLGKLQKLLRKKKSLD
jgi:hypothetical protein